MSPLGADTEILSNGFGNQLSNLFFKSLIDIFNVLTRIERLKKVNEHFLNSSQSVNFEYLSMNLGLKVTSLPDSVVAVCIIKRKPDSI